MRRLSIFAKMTKKPFMKRPILSIILIFAVVFPTFSQRILKDIAQGTDNARIFATSTFASGDTLFFAADTIDATRMSYRYYQTNGTTVSTKSLVPDNQMRSTHFYSSNYFYKFKDAVYGFNNNTIFKIKNDSVQYIGNAGNNNSFVSFFELNNELYLLTHRSLVNTYDFWKINTSEKNATLYKSITTPESLYYNKGFTLNNKYFQPIFINDESSLLQTDATDLGSTIIENNRMGYGKFQQVGNKVYYSFADSKEHWYKYQLWRSEGDSASTTKALSEIDSDTNYTIASLTKLDNNLYFISTVNNRSRVSKFDAISSNLSHISSSHFLINNLQVKNQKIYYSIYDNSMVNFYENNGSIDSQKLLFSIPGTSGFRLYIGTSKIYVSRQKDYTEDVIHWVYDGTTLKKINDLVPNIYMGSIDNVIDAIGDIFYFSAADGQHGYELWRTDGTFEGTYLLKDINKKPASSFPKPMFGLGNHLYFMADDISRGNEVWRIDGTNTALFADLNGSPYFRHVSGSDYHSSVKYRDSQIAYINAGLHQFTANGELNSLNFLPFYPYSLPQVYNDSIYFSGNDGNLWKTDATSNGTKKAIHLDSTGYGGGYGDIKDLTTIGNSLFFTSNNGGILWKTNGKKNGTVKLKEFAGSLNIGALNYLTTWLTQDKFFFTRNNYTSYQSELWVSDGTSTGTIKLTPKPSFTVFGVFNNKLIFQTNHSLWESDGTSDGTVEIDSRSFDSGIQLNDKFYLLRSDYRGDVAYFELDKNNNIRLLDSLFEHKNLIINTSDFYQIDNRYVINYIVEIGTNKQHFYITDGNSENIKKAFVLDKSLPVFNEYQFTYHNKKIYFTALDSLKGQELWIWDFECPDGYTVRDAINKDSTVVYGKNIWGQNIVGSNKTVTYDAKNSITLQPGFEAQKGTVFKTKLIGCANNAVPNTTEDTSPIKNEPLVKVNVDKPQYPQLIDFLYYLPNKHLKDIYERAQINKLAPVSWNIVTEENIYRLDLKIGTNVIKGFLPKKN